VSKLAKTDLNTVMFEVTYGPLYYKKAAERNPSPGESEQPDLLGNIAPGTFAKLPKFQAIVDVERDHTFAVVTSDYKLVTNKEAIELGKKCVASIFHSKIGEGLKVFNITMPKTRSFCHIDFVYEGSKFQPWENDTWSPFLRVTNSYNRTRLLRFDLGFCRWICTNGMIFGEKSITFRYNHTRSDMNGRVEFNSDIGDLRKIEAEFIEKLHNLKRFHVPENAILPLICRAFEIQITSADLQKERRVEQLRVFKQHVNSLTRKYFEALGPTGYAALNIVTDFATRPSSYISPEGVMDRLQRMGAVWCEEFIREIKDDHFSFDAYLKDYKGGAETINTLN
jgi:hypothetical protein